MFYTSGNFTSKKYFIIITITSSLFKISSKDGGHPHKFPELDLGVLISEAIRTLTNHISNLRCRNDRTFFVSDR